jgi:Domain of unknown function (DUF4157)
MSELQRADVSHLNSIAVDRQSLIAQFPALLPLAVDWAKREERRIRETGVPLTAQELADAKASGVAHPEQVRLLEVEVVPRPENPTLQAACDQIDFLPPATRGLTLGYGIFIRQDCWRERSLIAHELAHVAQYERMGGTEPFLRRYLMECLTVGYNQSALEREATEAAGRVAPRE